eukprot:TRINITY_DN19394_c0_g1_i1.p1 TRINITY_DN19394_c0_g1~~TRINITY_DN19394_c0_g1_i1.p1  ORF type:complete len:971 (+),score=186.71 TRINITY_DN19394_c0_g1_i1:75-2987(+)
MVDLEETPQDLETGGEVANTAAAEEAENAAAGDTCWLAKVQCTLQPAAQDFRSTAPQPSQTPPKCVEGGAAPGAADGFSQAHGDSSGLPLAGPPVADKLGPGDDSQSSGATLRDPRSKCFGIDEAYGFFDVNQRRRDGDNYRMVRLVNAIGTMSVAANVVALIVFAAISLELHVLRGCVDEELRVPQDGLVDQDCQPLSRIAKLLVVLAVSADALLSSFGSALLLRVEKRPSRRIPLLLKGLVVCQLVVATLSLIMAALSGNLVYVLRKPWGCVLYFARMLLVLNLIFQWKRAHRRADDDTVGEPLQDISAHFQQELAREGRRCEIAYVVAEGLAIFIFLGLLCQDEENIVLQIHVCVTLFCFAARIYRCAHKKAYEKLARLSLVLDTFTFTWNACAAGFNGISLVTTFVLNICLSYLLILVLPFRRSIILCPICASGYILSALSVKALCYDRAGLMVLGMCLNLVAKKLIENSKKEAFLLIEEKKQQAIHEKVRRFQVEFENEVLSGKFNTKHGGLPELPETGRLLPKEFRAVAAACGASEISGPSTEARSARSAPAVTYSSLPRLAAIEEQDALLSDDVGVCTNGDCLPLDAVAWVEGEASPQPLSKLQAGNRILCYDRLAGHMKHAEVVGLDMNQGEVEWAKVTLEDGTTLEVTSDHPVHVQMAEEVAAPWGTKPPVKAGDLREGHDCILVLKHVPVPVKRVEKVLEARERVALHVSQPERHAPFIAAGQQAEGTMQAMAVEANNRSDACVIYDKGAFYVTTNAESDREFVLDSAQKRRRHRPSSAPPSLRGLDETRRETLRLGANTMRTQLPVLSLRGDRSAATRTASSCGDSSSMCSIISEGNREVVVASPLTVQSLSPGGTLITQPAGENAPARLSDLLAVRAAGLVSIGSTSHQGGDCKACAFHSRHVFFGGKPCYKGALCERCHEQHDAPLQREKRQYKKRVLRDEYARRTLSAAAPQGASG